MDKLDKTDKHTNTHINNQTTLSNYTHRQHRHNRQTNRQLDKHTTQTKRHTYTQTKQTKQTHRRFRLSRQIDASTQQTIIHTIVLRQLEQIRRIWQMDNIANTDTQTNRQLATWTKQTHIQIDKLDTQTNIRQSRQIAKQTSRKYTRRQS